MKSPSTSGVCLATATTESFVPGALVLLGSFLKHHPRFDGDLVIIHDALPQAARDALQALSDRVRFETVSTRLRDRLAHLAAGHPAFASGREYFYSLEAFRLHGYRKVLFYDSDVLVRAPLDACSTLPARCCAARTRSPSAAGGATPAPSNPWALPTPPTLPHSRTRSTAASSSSTDGSPTEPATRTSST